MVFLEIAFRIFVPRPPKVLHTDRSETFFYPDASRMHPYVNPDSELTRIAVIGDSFTQGAAVQEVDTFARKLECFLNMNDVELGVQVDNYGRPGTSTFQQLEKLEHAFEQDPDIVVLEITLNDTEDWADPATIKRWRDQIIPSRPSAPFRWLFDSSKLLSMIYGKYAAVKSKEAFVQYYRNIYDSEYSGWVRFCNAVAEFKSRCDAKDTALVVMIFPLFSHDLREFAYPFHEMHEKIIAELKNNGISYFDLYPIVKNIDHLRLEAISGIDPHPNEIAHRIAAETLLEFLVNNNLIDKRLYPVGRSHPGIHEQWQKIYERMTLIDAESSTEKH